MTFTRDGDVRDLFQRLEDAALGMTLGDFATTREERERAFEAARKAFAERLKVAEPSSATPPDLARAHFARPLFLHIAALASVRGDRLATEDELLDWLLGREEGTWRKMLEASSLSASQFMEPFAQGAALLTLAGGAFSLQDARSLLRRIPGLADQPIAILDVAVRILAILYPGAGLERERRAEAPEVLQDSPVEIAGVRPDLLGEELVSRNMATLMDVVFGDGASEALIIGALTVLTRLAQRRPTTKYLLQIACDSYFDRLTKPALNVAMETGDPIGVILSEVLTKHKRLDIAYSVYHMIPINTLALRELAVAALSWYKESTLAPIQEVVQHGIEKSSINEMGNLLVRRAISLSELGHRLERVGRSEEAFRNGEEAVYIFSQLAKAVTSSDDFDDAFATAANNLALHHLNRAQYQAAQKRARLALVDQV